MSGAVELRPVAYEQDGVVFDGALATAGGAARPGVLVLHGWEGRSDGQDRFAVRLAEMGYAAFSVDLYGDGRRGSLSLDGAEINQALMTPLMDDRALLRRRLLGAVDAVAALDEVRGDMMAAIGFCFGGLCALDLARANAPVKAVASFHGGLAPPPMAPPERIVPKIAVYHGWADPLVTQDALVALGAELSAAQADWQATAYGGAMHAFMAEGLDAPEQGLQYHERSARRAWAAMAAFLEESFA